jgi:hypothetical protein
MVPDDRLGRHLRAIEAGMPVADQRQAKTALDGVAACGIDAKFRLHAADRKGFYAGLVETFRKPGALKGAAMGFGEHGLARRRGQRLVEGKAGAIRIQRVTGPAVMLDENDLVARCPRGVEQTGDAADSSIPIMWLERRASEHTALNINNN